MKPPKTDDLIAYLYDEADDPTREAVDLHLEKCDRTRGQVDDWRATMDLLDKWVVESPAKTRHHAFAPRAIRVLGMAAMLVLLLSLGIFIGQQGISSSSTAGLNAASPAAASPDPAEIEALVEQRLAEERAQWAIHHQEIERKLILASAAMTHRQVQEHVDQALQHLEENAVRNETLALFLPPGEQQAYQRKRQALEELASGVARESQRHEKFTQQIIERARTRALQAH